MIKITECPRDAMQGLKDFIPTQVKANYINALLQVGFDTIDFGSFVSPKAIPQLSDTAEVVKMLDLSDTNTKLLAIIGNQKGAENALQFDEISYLGFPFSISNTFLNLNIKSTYQQALNQIDTINTLAKSKNKQMVVYLSMAFGNPYGEPGGEELLVESVEKLQQLGITRINVADTVGFGNPKDIGSAFNTLNNKFKNIEFGLHLHTTSQTYYQKIDEAYTNGCRKFDSVMLGLGGCPFSSHELVGNLSTENLLRYFEHKNIPVPINMDKYLEAQRIAASIFGKYQTKKP